MPAVAARDDVYCHLTARRAVARAALHLGVERMTAESVDVLAACLLEYLERLGATTAATVEASGRSSAHCHILDALAAAELCTSHAVAAVHAAAAPPPPPPPLALDDTATDATTQPLTPHPDGTGVTAASVVQSTHKNVELGATWKDLAAFCFGPHWNTDPAVETQRQENITAGGSGGGSGNAGVGGKVGPSSIVMLGTKDEWGWNAPYPDEVPYFPLCSPNSNVANPHPFVEEPALHRLDTSVVVPSEAHQLVAESVIVNDKERSLDIPDEAFRFLDWGGFRQTATGSAAADEAVVAPKIGEKRPSEHGNDAVNDDDGNDRQRGSKRIKLSDGTILAKRRPSLPSYIPTFYPPLPTHQNDRFVVVMDTMTSLASDDMNGTGAVVSAAATALAPSSSATLDGNGTDDPTSSSTNPTRKVRSALVLTSRNPLTLSYWGSSWAAIPGPRVTVGRAPVTAEPTSTSAAVASSSTTAATTATATASSSIVPLIRASGSRVSRILKVVWMPPHCD